MMRMGKLHVWLWASVIGLTTTGVYADTISFSDSIPPTATDWGSVVTLGKFDPSLGYLNHIEFELIGQFSGTMQFENTSSFRSLFSMLLEWDMELLRPDESLIVAAADARLEEGLLDPFDGTVDFDGPSGVTFEVSAEAIETALLTEQADFDLFTGAGTIQLPIGATGIFTADANAEPYETAHASLAGAEVTVTYDYTIPEPGTLTLLGLVVVAAARRRS